MNITRGTKAEIIARVDGCPTEVLLLEPRQFFDEALIGTTDEPQDNWSRKVGAGMVAVYDPEKCVKAIVDWLDCSWEEAEEWYDVNTAGAWLGEGTPTFQGTVADDTD